MTELFGQAWSKESLKYRSPNVIKLIEWFNFVAKFVATHIVLEKKLKNRVQVFQIMILIAEVNI